MSSLKLMSPRPFEGVKVCCAKDLQLVNRAKRASCPLFTYLLGKIPPEELRFEEEGLMLNVGGYSLGAYASDRLTRTAETKAKEKGAQRDRALHYWLHYDKWQKWTTDEPELAPGPPALRLCADLESGSSAG
jgi:hypothetical protein